MTERVVNFDETSDTLYISFSPGEAATGVELSEHILLRLNKAEQRAVGLTLFEFSLLAQRTELGPRSFPLHGLARLPAELRELALDILQRPPVSDILSLSAYTPSALETIPIVSIRSLPIVTA